MKIRHDNLFLEKIKEFETVSNYHVKWSLGSMRAYEKKWKRLVQKYSGVSVYGIEFMGIGETAPRLFMYMRDWESRDRNILHVVLPTFSMGYYTGGIVNHKIFDIYKKYIYFITEKNIGFWKYVSLFHLNQVSVDRFDMYKLRDIAYTFKVDVGKPLLTFSEKTDAYAKEKLQEMGINGEYICIHAREVATKKNNFISTYEDTSIIDADINSYGLACAYMRGEGCQAVRLGKDESRKCEIDGIIDYANCFYDELMDFYLLANCRFIIGGMAGIVAVASFWGRPVLQVNTLSFCYGQESLSRTDYDLYIPKKLYSRHEKRLLNLYESWDASFKCDRFNERFEEEGIEVIDNTEEEILNAAVEMNEKLNHTWIQTEEEKQYIEKYWQIIELWKDRHKLTYISRKDGGRGRDSLPRTICYSYLKENLYLLDVKELHEKS